MSHITRLLQRGIPVICQRPPLLETPKKLNMSESELKAMVPNFIIKEIAIEKRDEAIRKAKAEAAKPNGEEEEARVNLQHAPQKFLKRSPVVTDEREMAHLHNIKMSDRIHACLVQTLSSGKLRDPLLLASDLHICNVSLSHSRSKAIVQWSLLGVADPARIRAVDQALDSHRKQIAHLIGQQISTRFLPSYLFEYKEDPFAP